MDTPQEKETTGTITDAVVVSNDTPAVTPEAPVVNAATVAPLYKNKHMIVAVVVAIALLGGAGYFAYSKYYSEPVVATVNGNKIYQKEFDESIKLVEQNMVQLGADLNDQSIKDGVRVQALEVLVNNMLFISAAEDAGFTVSDTDVQAKYDELTVQVGGAEELVKKMAEIGLTEEKLRSNIVDRILADQYIEANTDIENLTVTDAEIDAFVKNLNTGETELPPLEEITPQIKMEILAQKQQQIVADLLTKLRGEADIVTKQ